MKNFAINLSNVPDGVIELLKGMEPRIEWTESGLNVTFPDAKITVAKQKSKSRRKANPREELKPIPGKAGWVYNPNGNEFYRFPVWEDRNGNLWVGNRDEAVKIREDTDEDFLGVELQNGTVIEKILQAPKRLKVNDETFEVWEAYKRSAKYRQVITDGILYVSPNLSRDGDKVQSVKAKENSPIVSVDYPTAMELATKVGYGEWESELMHDAEYSLDWIYQVYVKGDRSAMNNEYYLWLRTKTNNSSRRVVARSIHGSYDGVGSRGWHDYGTYGYGITFRVALKRSTDH